eukprot:snap_masked-scaffold_25-processed-gene-1.11-mRNA-1 protein AED:1.00 eAED:1.00 QI:0/0/0/0/1/1/4/0/88
MEEIQYNTIFRKISQIKIQNKEKNCQWNTSCRIYKLMNELYGYLFTRKSMTVERVTSTAGTSRKQPSIASTPQMAYKTPPTPSTINGA